MPIEVLTKVYKPMMTVGQVYARPYGSAVLPTPVGNVLELALNHTEDVQRQQDMTKQGGGTHAEVRRVTDVQVAMRLADLNVVNLARAALGTVSGIASGTVVDEPFDVSALGTLLPLLHIGATAVVVKKGATAVAATAVAATGNYEVRGSGVVLLSDAPDIAPADKLWVSYSYGDYAAIEALTTKAVELELIFDGLNEADSGKPVSLNIWRASQGVTQAMTLLNTGFNGLNVAGTVLQDPTKQGSGISQYYRTRMV